MARLRRQIFRFVHGLACILQREDSKAQPVPGVTAGWGHAGKGGVTMPANGKTSVPAVANGRTAVPAVMQGGARPTGETPVLPSDQTGETPVLRLSGGTPDLLDIYLNDVAGWRHVPRPVWEYAIGGYQVIKKWLSYREKELLGRGLTPDEVRYVTELEQRKVQSVGLTPGPRKTGQCARAVARHPS